MFSNNNELNLNEKHLSHIPAVKTLIALGYKLLNQEDLKKERSNLQDILLEDILIDQIKKLNKAKHNFKLDDEDAKEAVRQLTSYKPNGLIKTNQEIYDLLTLGANIKKNFKGYDLKYIDWQEPWNNVYHVAFEVPVESKIRIGSIRICDIVLFVNGIPFVVIENKSPTESLDQAISQHIRNQRSDEIPQLFYYAQILITVNKNEAKYATIGSSKKYWSTWREETEEKQNIDIIRNLINTPLYEEVKNNLYTGDFVSCRDHFDKQELAGNVEPTEQDKVLYALCRPERLLDLVVNFCVFDNSVRKIARHHQFFATHAAVKRVLRDEEHNIRKGGVIWHTQGTGKSLTMIFIAKFLLESANIASPRIIIITDRIELDEQIKHAFKNCGFEPKLATSSKNLIELLRGSTSVITSVIHKFNKAFFQGFQDFNNNFFVLVDESHRTQYGDLADKMRIILPNACYLGFTGTPLLKEQKNTMEKFGGLIHKYTIKDALKDSMIVPLFYEGRNILKRLNNESLLNKNFDIITDGVDEETKVALKKAYSSLDALSNTKEVIKAKAADISRHYSTTFKGTGLKAMLIAPSRSIAIHFKKFLDEINQVSSEVVISSVDDREGHEDIESKNEIQEFLATQKGLRSNQIIEKFKNADNPEILIVVSKLLTGFDAPRNTVVYICKKLKEQSLLQAIARANRLFEENEKTKEYGYIIDYEGLAVKLDDACKLYDSDKLKNFDKEDLKEAIFVVNDKIKELFPLLQKIKNIFTNVSNNSDPEQLEQYLADENIRSNFYFLLDRLKNLMSIFSNSNKLAESFKQKELEELYNELKNFNKLKKIVEKRYNEKTDKKIYTDQIAKLLDEHITAGDIIKTGMINIFDEKIFINFMKRTDITGLEKANQINNEIRYILNNCMRIDPALFQKFTKLINDTIAKYNKSLSDSELLNKYINIINELKKDVPSELDNNKTKLVFYRKLLNFLQDKTNQNQHENAIQIAHDTYNIIKQKIIVHWSRNTKTINEMRNSLDDYFFDVVEKKIGIIFKPEDLNEVVESLIDFAKEHEAK